MCDIVCGFESGASLDMLIVTILSGKGSLPQPPL